MDKGNDKYQEEYKKAINALEDSIKKNNEDQTKQVTSIGWAGIIFLVSMNLERFVSFGIWTKTAIIITVILFNSALILEYTVCFLSIKFSEHLGLEDDENKRKGLKWYKITRVIRSLRDSTFLSAMIFLIITIIMIIMQGMENKEDASNKSHVNYPVMENKTIILEIQKTNENIQVNFSNIPSPRTVNLSIKSTHSKENNKK